MARLTSIELSGWKSIEHAKIEFGNLNVLVGPNGGGKSNLLAFLRLLGLIPMMGVQRFLATAGGAAAFLRRGPAVTRRIKFKCEVSHDSGQYTYQAALEYAAPDRVSFVDESVARIESSGAERPTAWGPSGLESTILFPGQGVPGVGPVSGVLAQCATFHFHDTSLTAAIRRSCYIEDNRRLWNDGGNLAAVLYRLQVRDQPAYKLIVTQVRQLYPHFGDFSLAPGELDPTRILLNWTERGSDYLFGPHLLSDGTLRAIALVTLLLLPEAELPLVLVIDEPELGLHPHAIDVIGGLLRSVSHSCQVIVSTQSVQMVNQFAPEDVIVVNRGRDGASRYDRLAVDELEGWLEDYSLGEVWRKNVFGGGPY